MQIKQKIRYPNLDKLSEVVDGIIQNKHYPDTLDIYVFPQLWGSSLGGIDVNEKGQSLISESVITKQYTTVFIAGNFEVAFVFFEEKLAYTIEKPNDIFTKDLKRQAMKQVSLALKKIQRRIH